MENKKQKLNELYRNLGSLYEMRQRGDSLQAKLAFESSEDLLEQVGVQTSLYLSASFQEKDYPDFGF